MHDFSYTYFFPSLDYRNTTGFFSPCGTVDKPCISFFTLFNDELTYLQRVDDNEISRYKRRHPNLFTNSNINMHPAIYGWRVIISKLMKSDKVRIYYKQSDGLKEKFGHKRYNENYKKYFDQSPIHFIPHTMIRVYPIF